VQNDPYTDNGDIRTFDITASQEEYVWHQDKEDRKILVVSGNGWQLQMEDCLPFLLTEGLKFIIPKYTYHRLIKGVDNLQVQINREV